MDCRQHLFARRHFVGTYDHDPAESPLSVRKVSEGYGLVWARLTTPGLGPDDELLAGPAQATRGRDARAHIALLSRPTMSEATLYALFLHIHPIHALRGAAEKCGFLGGRVVCSKTLERIPESAIAGAEPVDWEIALEH